MAPSTAPRDKNTHLLEPSGRADLNILIPSHKTDSSYILGPILKPNQNPTNLEFTKTPLLFTHRSINVYSWHPSNRPLRSWPVPHKLYLEWLDRVEPEMCDLWREIGIYDVLQLSRNVIKPDPYLIGASLCFWSTETSCLHLRYGMCGPTLFDLAAIAGLRPHGTGIAMAKQVNLSNFSYLDTNFEESRAFTVFIARFNRKTGPVGFHEHTAFLWYWICRFIACSPSNKMNREYLGLAICLAEGKSLALGRFVLGELYRGIRDVISDLSSERKSFEFTNAGGPYWIYQLWLYAYFPELRQLGDCQIRDSPTNYGQILTHYGPKWVKLTDSVFIDYFGFFYNLKSRSAEKISPFADRRYGPAWFKSKISTYSKENSNIWSSFLSPAGLYVGLAYKSNSLVFTGVEYYYPNCVARQFGLIQGVPYLMQNDLKFKTLNKDLDRVERVNSELKERYYSHKGFSRSPSTTRDFDLFWEDYVKITFSPLVSELKRRFLFSPRKSKVVKSKGTTLERPNKKVYAESITSRVQKAALSSSSGPPRKKIRVSSSSPSSSRTKVAPSKKVGASDLKNKSNTKPKTKATMNPKEKPQSLDNITQNNLNLGIDSMLSSIEVDPNLNEEELLAFVDSLSKSNKNRASNSSKPLDKSNEIKAKLDELASTFCKDFTTICEDTELVEKLKELLHFLIGQAGHDLVERETLFVLHEVKGKINLMQSECVSACKFIKEFNEDQEQEGNSKIALQKLKKLIDDVELELQESEKKKRELNIRRSEHERKIREIEKELAGVSDRETQLICQQEKATQEVKNLGFTFKNLIEQRLAREEEKATAERVLNAMNSTWLGFRNSFTKG